MSTWSSSEIFFIAGLLLVAIRVAAGCSAGFWGPPQCTGVCHCSPAGCDIHSGQCLSITGSCVGGWTNFPFCQTACPTGTFGIKCALKCHCPPSDSCSHINGLCDGGKCSDGWTGGGCQTGIPVLSDAPVISTVTATSVTVTWRPWASTSDVGNALPIHSYRLDYQSKGSDTTWHLWQEIPEDLSRSSIAPYNEVVTGLEPYTDYRFRLTVIWLDNGKRVGEQLIWPGPPSSFTRTRCSGPPPAPTDLQLDHPVPQGANLVNISVSWKASPGPTESCCQSTNFTVVVRCDDGSIPEKKKTVPFTMKTATFMDIAIQSCLHIRVFASNMAGLESPSSDPLYLSGNVNIYTTRSATTSTTLSSYTTATMTVSSSASPPKASVPRTPLTSTTLLTTQLVATAPPDHVHNLRIVQRTAESLTLTWDEPKNVTNPTLLSYKVTVAIEASYTAADLQEADKLLVTKYLSVVIYNLQPASKYKVTVDTFLAGTPGGSVSESYWTEPELPEQARPPVVLSVEPEKATVKIYPSSHIIPNLSSYQILVEELAIKSSAKSWDEIENSPQPAKSSGSFERQRRAIDNDANYARKEYRDYFNARMYGEDMYITAELFPGELQAEKNFTIGDRQYYGKIYQYYNAPLEQQRAYQFWFSIVSELDGISRRSLVRTIGRVDPNFILVHEQTVDSASRSKGGVVGWKVALIVLALSVFIIFVIVGIFWWRRRKTYTRYRYPDILSYHRGSTLGDEESKLTGPNRSRSATRRVLDFTQDDSIDFESNGPEIRVKREGEDPNYYVIKKSNPILIDELASYFYQHETNGHSLAEEFKHLPSGFTAAALEAKDPQNLDLNRTMHCLPFDRNRVTLERKGLVGGQGDYINASWVEVGRNSSYIVTQAPMAATKIDFWGMIWEQQVGRIVALMDLIEYGKPNYEQYWPNSGAEQFGPINVEMLREDSMAHYSIRALQLSNATLTEVRLVHHFQFHSWLPPGGIPIHPIPFLEFVHKTQQHISFGEESVVHCQLGNGRSGLFVAVDYLLCEGFDNQKVDILKCVTQLRLERPNMVKTMGQYCSIHECLIEAFCAPDSLVDVDQFHECCENLNRNISGEFESLNPLVSPHKPLRKLATIGGEESLIRFISPLKSTPERPLSRTFMSTPTKAKKLSKLFVAFADSYLQKDIFLMAQSPQEPQIAEFWNIVYESRTSCIIFLDDVEELCTYYWPEPLSAELFGKYEVVAKSSTLDPRNNVVTDMMLHRGQDSREIRLYQYVDWPSENPVPRVKSVLDFCLLVMGWHNSHGNKGRVLLHCPDGSSRSGLLVALWVLLERAQADQKVDVCRTVRFLRSTAPHAVQNLDQYRLCYNVVKEYLHHGQASETMSSVIECSDLI